MKEKNKHDWGLKFESVPAATNPPAEMRRGRPPKCTQRKNIKGLRNQHRAAAKPQQISSSSESDDVSESPSKKMRPSHPPSRSRAPSPASVSSHESGCDAHTWHPPIMLDSMKMVSNCDDSQSDIESDAEEISDTYLNDSGLYSRLIDLAVSLDDNPQDETWLPPKEAKRLAQRMQRPQFYKKGPDVGSKSARTQRRYKELLRNQKSLNSLGFTVLPKSSQPAPSPPALSKSNDNSSASDLEDADTINPALPLGVPSTIATVEERPASSNLEPSIDMGLASNVEEMWEDELQEREQGGVEVRGWYELREQIKKDLEKGAK